MYRRPGRAERMARGMFGLDGTAAGVMAGMTLELDDERVCPQTTTVAAALAHHRSATIGETGTVCCALHELQARRLVPRTEHPRAVPSLSIRIGQNAAVFAATPVNLVFAVAQKDLRDANPRRTCSSSKAVTSLT